MITLPQGLTIEQWTDSILVDLPETTNRYTGDWQEWASQLLLNTDYADYNLPNPYMFEKWNGWAERFCGAIKWA